MRYPEKYGGSESTILGYALATEELAKGSLSLAAACSMQSLMGTYFIYRSPHEEIRQKFLVPALKGELVGVDTYEVFIKQANDLEVMISKGAIKYLHPASVE